MQDGGDRLLGLAQGAQRRTDRGAQIGCRQVFVVFRTAGRQQLDVGDRRKRRQWREPRRLPRGPTDGLCRQPLAVARLSPNLVQRIGMFHGPVLMPVGVAPSMCRSGFLKLSRCFWESSERTVPPRRASSTLSQGLKDGERNPPAQRPSSLPVLFSRDCRRRRLCNPSLVRIRCNRRRIGRRRSRIGIRSDSLGIAGRLGFRHRRLRCRGHR